MAKKLVNVKNWFLQIMIGFAEKTTSLRALLSKNKIAFFCTFAQSVFCRLHTLGPFFYSRFFLLKIKSVKRIFVICAVGPRDAQYLATRPQAKRPGDTLP